MAEDLGEIVSYSGPCPSCSLGKQSRKPFPKTALKRATRTLELLHSDICGPMSTESLGNNLYFVLFIDDYTRMTWVYFLKQKSEVFSVFKRFKQMIEVQSGLKIKVLRTDNGGEYTSNEFKAFCDEFGIVHQLTIPYSPQQNGVAERKNRTVMEMARCLLFEKKLPKTFWCEAVNTAVYLLNRLSTKAVEGMTPIEAWSGLKPSFKHLKVFGCVCFFHVHSSKRTKLDERAQQGIFLGYSSNSKEFRIFDIFEEKIVLSRDVVFDEEAYWDFDLKNIIWGENCTSITPSTTRVVTSFDVEGTSDSPIVKTKPVGNVYESCNTANAPSNFLMQ